MRILLFVSVLLFSMCKPANVSVSSTKKVHLLYIDSSRYAVLNFDPKKHSAFFDKVQKADTLTADDIDQVEKLIADTVKKYNKGSTSVQSFINRPDKYYKQFIAVINQKGEREVWVNCFCFNYHYDWKNTIIMVDDGGNCYFQLEVNLTKNTLEEFSINGSA